MAQINLFAANGKNAATGYGRLEIGLIRSLRNAGLEVKDYTPKTKNKPKNDAPTLIVGSPLWGEKVSGRLWVYTMSEADKVSEGWVDAMNTLYERVFVPCPDLVTIYQDSGVTIPVSYVPMGVDYNPPPFTHRSIPSDVFTFLGYSLGDMRKGAELTLFAFKRVFGGDMRYRLVIKCRDSAQWLEGLDDPQVTVIEGETTTDEWYNLLASAHAFVYPSRGEGFGLPPREAVLSGLPTIATQWLGMFDADKWAYVLPIQDMRVAQFDHWDANAEGSLWAEPDKDALDHQMKRIATKYPLALQRARAGRQYLLENFKWETTARMIAECL